MSIRAKRGTRSQVDAAAAANELLVGELIFISDEDVFAWATETNEYKVSGDIKAGDILITSRAVAPPQFIKADNAQYLGSEYPLLAPLLPKALEVTNITTGFSNNFLESIATDNNGTWVCTARAGEIRRSTDDGLTWSSTSNASSSSAYYATATDENGKWITVGQGGNANVSTDNGANWSNLNISGSEDFLGVATDKQGNWVVVGKMTGSFGTVRYSTNGGSSFSNGSVSNNHDINDVATDGSGVWITCGAQGRMMRSTNNGATWSTVSSGVFTELFGIATNGSGIWLAVGGFGTAPPGVATYSDDNGLTWTPITQEVGALKKVATDASGVWLTIITNNALRLNDSGIPVPPPSFSGNVNNLAASSNGVFITVGNSNHMRRIAPPSPEEFIAESIGIEKAHYFTGEDT